MPVPFFKKLHKKHVVPKVTSYRDNDRVRELQRLVDAGNNPEYRKKLAEYEEQGYQFRLTKGIVYENYYEGEELEVEIAVQVKGTSLTWYFWTPDGGMDQYPQAFRDVLFQAASECHQSVDNGCDLYYRGSNAVHIKLMHNLETESNNNHNHYRLKDNQHYQPEDFRQHLQAFKQHEAHDIFFEAGEVDTLCDEFKDFHAEWVAKQSEDAPSLSEQYQAQPDQVLTLADTAEMRIFGHQQEPCRIDVRELKIDYELARRELEAALASDSPEQFEKLCEKMDREYQDLLEYREKGGSRGLGSERASSRQVEGSANPVVRAVMDKDDALKSEIPTVPAWALSAKREVYTALDTLFAPLETQERRLGLEAEMPDELTRSRGFASPARADKLLARQAPEGVALARQASEGAVQASPTSVSEGIFNRSRRSSSVGTLEDLSSRSSDLKSRLKDATRDDKTDGLPHDADGPVPRGGGGK